MRFISAITALAAIVAASTTPAAAATTIIDFDKLRSPTGGYTYVFGPYQEDGFTLTAGRCQPSNFGPTCFVTPLSFMSMDKMGAALTTQYVAEPVTVTRNDGGLFSLLSMDVSEYWDNMTYPPFTGTFKFSFTDAQGQVTNVSRTFSKEGKNVPQNLLFNTAPLRSFTFNPLDAAQFDNITLKTMNAVPEPGTWLMMIVGFGFAGMALRGRRDTERRFNLV